VLVAVKADHHVLQHGRLGQEPDVLEGAGYAAPRDDVGLLLGDIGVVEEDSSRRQLQRSGDEIDDGALTGPIGPDQPRDLPARRSHGQVRDRVNTTERFGDAFKPQH
jgi:hypothetical protein